LASCYRESLKLASDKGIETVAFPSISTGAYGYPVKEAAGIALQTVRDYLAQHPEIRRVRFVLFGQAAYAAYEEALRKLCGAGAWLR
jgi:O-acetyl-ADP-ribose deacetylase (regulator of RNase III)